MITAIETFQLLDVVALNESLPEQGLLRGQVGTIVELLAPDVYEVEFNDDGGQTYAMLPLRANQLIQLHYSPAISRTAVPPIQTKSMANTIHQYGQGDNIAGDKVMGDKINTQINHSQDLTQAAKDIKALLDQLSTDYPTDNDTLIGAKAIMKVEGDPTLKQRLINAIQEGGAAAIEELTQHPAIKIVLAALKGAADA